MDGFDRSGRAHRAHRAPPLGNAQRVPISNASRSRATATLSSLLLVAVLLDGCTVSRFDQADCRETAECRAAFGIGFVCQEDGFCLREEPPPRCRETQPDMLFEDDAESADRIVIGTLVDKSLATHVARANAVRLAVLDANNAGGLDGRRFGLVVCDIQRSFMGDELNREEAAVEMARYLEEVVGVPAIIGAPGSGETQSVYLSTREVVLISPSSTSPALTTLEPIPASDEVPGRLWRTAPTDEEQARQIGVDMDARGISEAFVVAQNGAYGDGLVALLGNEPRTAISVRFSTAGTLSNALNVVAEADAEEIVFISSDTSDTVSFLTAAVEDPRLDGKSFMLTDAAANEDLLTGLSALSPEQATNLYARIRGTRPRRSDGLTTEFATRYRIEFGETDVEALSFTSHAFDAGWLALYGAVWAELQEGAVSPFNLARGLRQVSEGDAVDVGELSWPDVVEAFRAGRSVDVNGASGALDYDPDTEERSEAGRGFDVWQISSDGDVLCEALDTACISGS